VATLIKFQAGPKLDMESLETVLGPLLFVLYIIDFVIDLPKITNSASAPIIFADTSILFAHSNLIDCSKNIYIVFKL
jgi:hypothetical protein